MAINTIEDVKALSNEELHRKLADPAQRDELNRIIREDAAKRAAEKVEQETLKNAAAARGVSIEEYKVLVAAEVAQAAADQAAKEAADKAAEEAATAEAIRVAAQEEADKKAAIASEFMQGVWKAEDDSAKQVGVTIVRDSRGNIAKLVEDYQVTNEDGTPLGRPTHLEARNWAELTLKKREAHIQATRAFSRLKSQKLTFRQQTQPEQQGPKTLTEAEMVEAVKELLSEDTAKSAAAAQRLKDTDPVLVKERVDAEKIKIAANAELVTYKFLQRHLYDFNNCDANRKILGEYFEENNLEWTQDNLEAALIALEGQLAPPVVQTSRATATVDNPTVPVPQPAVQPAAIPAKPTAVPAATATPAAPAQPARPALELPVPPRPGVNASIQPGSMPGRRPGITTEQADVKLTKADILKMPKDQLKKLVADPVKRAQLNIILNSQ